MTDAPAYKFKYRNYGLNAYRDNCCAKSAKLRREAEILIARADQIDTECSELLVMLLPVEDADG